MKEDGLRKKLLKMGFKLSVQSWNNHGYDSGIIRNIHERLIREEIRGYVIFPMRNRQDDEIMAYDCYVLPNRKDCKPSSQDIKNPDSMSFNGRKKDGTDYSCHASASRNCKQISP